MSMKLDKRKVGSGAAVAIIITTLLLSSIYNGIDIESDPVPEFAVFCEEEIVLVGEELNCYIEESKNIKVFIWNFHDNSVFDTLLSSQTTNTHSFNQSGIYQISVIGYNSYNLSKIQTATVSVIESFPALELNTNATFAYEDQPIEFTVSNKPSNLNFEFQWEFGDMSFNSGETVVHKFKDKGHYVVRLVATAENGLTQTLFQNITISNFIPVGQINTMFLSEGDKIEKTEIYEDQILEFDASESYDSLSDVSDLEFLWNFGDGSFSNLPVVNHTFTKEGIYSVKLTVMDDDGDKGTFYTTITVNNLAPIIESIDSRQILIEEGQTISLSAMTSDTFSDVSTLNYEWNINKNGWLATYHSIDESQQDISLNVTDNNGAVDKSSIIIETQNVAPIPSLQDAFSLYNVSFAIMGEKWHEINITLFSDEIPIVGGMLNRSTGDPWQKNVTFAYMKQDLQKIWKFELLYTPENDPINGNPNGANPVDGLFLFSDKNNNYTVKHTFNVQQPDTYNWTFYINPLQWGFPVMYNYHAFDPGQDDITIVTKINGVEEIYSTIYNEGSSYTEGDITTEIKVSNISSIEYYAFDEDGGISDVFTIPLSGTDPIKMDLYAPTVDLDMKNHGIEDELLSFKTQYLNPLYSNDSTELSYKWSLGDLSTGQSDKLTYFYENEGEYLVWVQVTNSIYSYATGKVIYIDNKVPYAQIAALPFNIIEDKQLNFEVTGIEESLSDRFNLQYFWKFSNGFTSSESSFQYSFPKSGTYSVELTISDDQADLYTETIEVVVSNADPLVINEIRTSESIEGETLKLSASYTDSIADKFNLQYKWTINGTEINGRQASLYLENGIYSVNLIVDDDDLGWSRQDFTIIMHDKVPIIRISDYVIYGNTSGTAKLAGSVSGSYFDRNQLSYCVEVISFQYSICEWKSTSSQNFYLDYPIFNLATKQYEIQAFVTANAQSAQNQHSFKLIVEKDTDGDELVDEFELMAGTDPNSADTDGDNLSDPFETAIYVEGPLSQYADFTKLFYGTDPANFDSDGDQLPDGYFGGYGELITGTDPLDNDTDDDGLLDGIEVIGWNITVISQGAEEVIDITTNPFVIDTDNDGLSDAEEYSLKSNPLTNDTDKDGIDDLRERRIGTSLVNFDTDSDGLNDSIEISGYDMYWYDKDRNKNEIRVYTDPWNNDTDGDGLLDGVEFTGNTDATSKDTDQDGLTDLEELSLARPTVPYKAHTDADNLFDGQEVNGWNVTVYTVTGAKYNEYGNVTLIEPTFSSQTRLITTDPWDVDTDGDLIDDYEELMPTHIPGETTNSSYRASDPTRIDSDGDGLNDDEDPIPLMTDFEPPIIDGDISLEYNVPLLAYVNDVLKSLPAQGFSAIQSIINNSADLLGDIWDLIKNGDLSNIDDAVDNYIKKLTLNTIQAENTSRSYLGDTLKFQNFAAGFTPVVEVVQDTIDFAYDIIAGRISLSEIWDRISSNILNAIGEIIDYVYELATSFANTWFGNNDDQYDKSGGQNWITFELPSISIDWKYCSILFVDVICGIDDVDVTGGFKLNVQFDRIIDVVSISLGGTFIIDFVDSISSIFGVLAPELTLEFDIYDNSGIDKVELWVNSDPNSDPATYTQNFYGAERGHFQWNDVVDLTLGCSPPSTGGGGQHKPGGGGGRSRVIPLSDPVDVVVQGIPEENLFSFSSKTINTADTCQSDLLQTAEFTIIMTDSQGSKRELEREKQGFLVDLFGKGFEIFDFILEGITNAINWVVDSISDIFSQGQQVFNDFVENVQEAIDTGIKLIEDGLRFIWEKFILEAIYKLKENYYDPARETVEELIDNSSESNSGEFFNMFRSEAVNSTLSGIEESIDQVAEVLEPIGDVGNAISFFIDDAIKSFLESLPLIDIIATALEKLKEIAFEIIMEVINRILEGILNSIISQLNLDVSSFMEVLGDMIIPLLDPSLVDVVSEIDVGTSESSSILNPLTIISSITDGLSAFSDIGNVYHTSLTNTESVLDRILNFFTQTDFGRDIILTLFPPLISVFLVLGDIFGGSLPISLDLSLGKLSLSSVKINQESVTNTISKANWYILAFGMISELGGQLRETQSASSYSKKIKGTTQIFYKFFLLIYRICEFTSSMLASQISNIRNTGLTILGEEITRSVFADYTTTFRQFGKVMGLIRGIIDLVIAVLKNLKSFTLPEKLVAGANSILNLITSKLGVTLEIDGLIDVLNTFKSMTYLVSILTSLIKAGIDLVNLIEISSEIWFTVISYTISIIENLVKLGVNVVKLLKTVFELFDKEAKAETFGKLLDKYRKLVKVRFIFFLGGDFLEDFIGNNLRDKVLHNVPINPFG